MDPLGCDVGGGSCFRLLTPARVGVLSRDEPPIGEKDGCFIN